MRWIYLSPHLDDAVFSCGGLIAQQSRLGDAVEIWTLCAGDPPDKLLSPFAQELHRRWGSAPQTVEQRRLEDRAACRVLQAEPRHFPIPDAIYRREGLNYWGSPDSPIVDPAAPVIFLYPDREAIFERLHPLESELIEQTTRRLNEAALPETRLVCPLTVGGHVDHRLTLAAARSLTSDLWYYADYPYAGDFFEQVNDLVPDRWLTQVFPLSEADLSLWEASMSAYHSQISSFWSGIEEMRSALHQYVQKLGGAALWSPP